MTISDHSLHFILDVENDVHYTDCLLTLDSPHYIWYVLRRNGNFQNILLLRLNDDDRLCIDVFDAESEQLLQRLPKSISIFALKRAVMSDRVPKLRLAEEELLQNLLNVKLKNGKKLALVFTPDAFSRVCTPASEKVLAKLDRLLSEPADRCGIFVRLPYQTDKLEKLLWSEQKESSVLTKAYTDLRAGSGSQPIPLIKSLASQLGLQLLRLDDQPREMLYLLWKLAVHDADSGDTPSALEDQAEYLEQCRIRRIGLFQPPPGSVQEQFNPISRRQAEIWLRDPSNREKLRRRAPLQQLPAAPPLPAHNDDLARKALGLSLPSHCRQKADWDTKLDQIKRNLITIWDQPRNREAVKGATSLCRSASTAIDRENWLCMEILVDLLKFFSMPEQLCASEARWNALEPILKEGQALIELCSRIHNKYSLTLAGDFADIINKTIDDNEMRELKMKREIVSFDIRYFEQHDSSTQNVDDIELHYGRVQQILKRSNDNIAAHYDQQNLLLRDQAAVIHRGSNFSVLPGTLETEAAFEPIHTPKADLFPESTDFEAFDSFPEPGGDSPFLFDPPVFDTQEDDSDLKEWKQQNQLPQAYHFEDDYL